MRDQIQEAVDRLNRESRRRQAENIKGMLIGAIILVCNLATMWLLWR